MIKNTFNTQKEQIEYNLQLLENRNIIFEDKHTLDTLFPYFVKQVSDSEILFFNKNGEIIIDFLNDFFYIEGFNEIIDKDFSMVKTGRGMEHYKNALIWSKVFLKKESFSSFSGDTVAFAILYPMEKLFECFVQWWLEKRYSHLQIEAQNGGYDFVTKENNKQLFGVRPDFLIKKENKVICVADAKWKLIENDGDFSQSDFYQLFAYKHIFLKEQKEYYKDDFCELFSLKIYYPTIKQIFESPKIFEYFDNTEIKIVPLDIETELLK